MSSVNPAHVGQYLARAIALHRAGQLREAETAYKFVLGLDPDHFEALHFLGLIEAQRENFTEADRLMSRSLAINTKTAEAFCNHARVLNALKRHDEALLASAKALAINPKSFESLVHQGTALQGLDKPEDALASLEKALAIKPDYAPALTNRGNLLSNMKRFEEALISYDKALAVNDRLVEALI